MQAMKLHEDKFLQILWDEPSRIIGIDWKDSTSSMTDDEFKAELTLFAAYVEERKAHGILVDVSKFTSQAGRRCTGVASEEHFWPIQRCRGRAVRVSVCERRTNSLRDEPIR